MVTRQTVFLLIGITWVAVAQDPPANKGLIRRGPTDHPEPQAPLLVFNMVALDAKGAPVDGLKETDLRIYDDGKVMHAAFCRPLQSGLETAPLGPEEYSNRPVRGDSQTILVLFDLLNEDLAERGLGWNEIAHAFKNLNSRDHVYVYLVTKDGTLYPVHPFPSAGSPHPFADPDWAAKVPALLDRAMHDVNSLRPQELRVNIDSRVRKSISVLKDLASDLGAQPGRKSLVWVTHGIPIIANNPVDGLRWDYTNLIRDLGTDLARAGIMLYAVDQSQRATMGILSMDTLEELAHLTGGVWLPSDETEKAIQQAVSEGAASYRVGYNPPLERWDNKFHKLRVTLNEKSKGIRLRAPESYFGDAREADPRDRFSMAALGNTDAIGIGIRAAVSPSAKVAGWLHFELRVDAGDLQLSPGDIATGGFDVTFAYYTTGWAVSAPILTQVHLTTAQRNAVLRDALEVNYDRPVSSGVSKVRLVVRDVHSGAVGSLTIPVAVPSQD